MIVRAQKNEHYSVISNYALEDKNISLKAKGLWAFVMTKPDGWKVNSRGLETQLKEGRDAILNAMTELEEAGYLVRGIARQEDGKFTTSDSIMYENPWWENPLAVNPSTKVNTDKVNTELSIYTEKKTPTKLEKTPEETDLYHYWSEAFGFEAKTTSAERRAVHKLLKEYPVDRIRVCIQVAATGRTEKYCPVITSFVKLEEKWRNMEAYIARKVTDTNIQNGRVVDLSNMR